MAAHERLSMTPVHSLWVLDVVDIFLVAALFYRLLILVKGTRSAQMYVGLLVIVLVGLLARKPTKPGWICRPKPAKKKDKISLTRS